MRRKTVIVTTFLLLLMAGCDRGGVRVSSDSLARAGDLQLGIEEASQLLAPVQGLPNEAPVVEALADFWLDYTLLALAVNRDGELERIDLASILRPEENQELVMQLREEVIETDEEISDEELEEIYSTERPGEQIRARHVLLLFPDGAGAAEVDSVRALAEEIRDRARAGADFAQLAETYSDDPGSASRGGDLNWFSRGTMVPPFEQAAFGLEPGEVSDVVESQFGLHVIRLEERDFPALEDIREQLRFDIQMERTQVAESTFVAGIEATAGVEIADGAIDSLRELAEQPLDPLSDREGRRALATFQGGSYTKADFRHFLLSQPPQFREQVMMAEDEQLDAFLRNLTRGELLVQEARRRGFSVDPEFLDDLRAGVREQYAEMAGILGLDGITPAEGESLGAAIHREVLDLMGRIVRGESDVYPLNGLSLPLREHFGAAVSDSGVERVLARVEALRAELPEEEMFEAGDPPELLDEIPPTPNPEDPQDREDEG